MQPSDTVMTPKRIFLSVLVFGVAGLLLFLYLQVQFEEQHTGWGPVNYLQPIPRMGAIEKVCQCRPQKLGSWCTQTCTPAAAQYRLSHSGSAACHRLLSLSSMFSSAQFLEGTVVPV
ncbi:Carbohydrate sulfotransferase 9 [Manis javanica]|nr:Carbohydrate sulfotransferase 9 [Manis javanica]